jgi:hypothetical protein
LDLSDQAREEEEEEEERADSFDLSTLPFSWISFITSVEQSLP